MQSLTPFILFWGFVTVGAAQRNKNAPFAKSSSEAKRDRGSGHPWSVVSSSLRRFGFYAICAVQIINTNVLIKSL